MNQFVTNLLFNDPAGATAVIESRLRELLEQKLQQLKSRIVAEMYEEIDSELELVEANVTRMGRQKLIRVRIRNGKVQRRKKLSAVPGYTTRGGKLVRMSAAERRHRKMAAKRSKFKRRAKLRQSLRKRKMALRRRKAMGL
jgi:hypothetical protein